MRFSTRQSLLRLAVQCDDADALLSVFWNDEAFFRKAVGKISRNQDVVHKAILAVLFDVGRCAKKYDCRRTATVWARKTVTERVQYLQTLLTESIQVTHRMQLIQSRKACSQQTQHRVLACRSNRLRASAIRSH